MNPSNEHSIFLNNSMPSLKYTQFKSKQINNVETGILKKRNEEFLNRNK